MKIFSIIFILLSGHYSWADKGAVEVWGSGHGIWVGSELHLLDLVESGGPRKSKREGDDWAWMPSLQNQLLTAKKTENIFYPELVDELSHKLHEIWILDPILTEALLKAIKVYNWILVPDALIAKPVENSMLEKEIFQVALRAGRSVSINKIAWDHMPSTHRVALVLHEALSALNEGRCTDLRTRQIIGLLFSSPMESIDSAYFQDFLGDCFPTQNNLQKRLLKKFGITESFNPPGVFQPARFETALFPIIEAKGSHHQKLKTKAFYFREDLDQFLNNCYWEPQKTLLEDRYEMSLKASYLNVRFSTLQDEGENLPRLIWEIIVRKNAILPMEVVSGPSCWSSASDASLSYLKNFFQYRLF